MDVAAFLREAPLFADLPAPAMAQFAAMAKPLSLRSGDCLFALGDAPEHFYLVLNGRLRVQGDGGLLAYVGRLEPVGEMGFIAGTAHTASVHAIRDSSVLRFPGAAFMALLHDQPATLLALTRLMLARAQQQVQQRRKSLTAGRGTVAIIPAADPADSLGLAQSLLRRWGDWPHARLIGSRHVDAELGAGTAQIALDDVAGSQRLNQWLHAMENRHRYVIYLADNASDNWARRCLRHADRVLLVAEAAQAPFALPVLESDLLAPLELVLIRADGDHSPHTRAWRQHTGARNHYFVHPGASADLDALAMQVTGRGVGLVLGGGGARGFAHIGLLRALEELRIPVHVMGGTSMGAFISALLACDYDSVEISHIARETFVSNNYLNDYTLPRVSLIQGRRFMRRLEEVFGARQIEDLRRSYYCISTSLTSGSAVIHDHGPLAAWVGTSMAVPGIAPPVAYKGELLCDGGVVDNLPTDVMQGMERGSIIASSVAHKTDIHGPGALTDEIPDPYALLQSKNRLLRPGFRDILLRTATLTADTVIQRESARRADVFLTLPVDDVSLFGWEHIDRLIETGYRHAMEQLGPLRESLVGEESLY
jgi:NTE family protein